MHEVGDLQGAIAALWDEARPRLRARVEALEAAAAGALDEAQRDSALIEAHTLVGTLGAFGMIEGTEAARAAERALQARDRDALGDAVRALRAVF